MRGFFHHPRWGHRDDGPMGGRHSRGPFRGGPFARRGREGRGFGHGGLRLVLLRMIADKPSHGYELIKDIEERFKGAYSPSPGVVYPTLSWLEDEGFITIEPGDDGRKSARITEAGQTFLNEKADEIAALFERMNAPGEQGHGDYAQLFRAMHNLRMALKMRGMKPLSQEQIDAAVDMIDEVARKIGRL